MKHHKQTEPKETDQVDAAGRSHGQHDVLQASGRQTSHDECQQSTQTRPHAGRTDNCVVFFVKIPETQDAPTLNDLRLNSRR